MLNLKKKLITTLSLILLLIYIAITAKGTFIRYKDKIRAYISVHSLGKMPKTLYNNSKELRNICFEIKTFPHLPLSSSNSLLLFTYGSLCTHLIYFYCQKMEGCVLLLLLPIEQIV